MLGGLAWERFVYDPLPGTRTLAEVTDVRALSPTVWLANARTATTTGVRFAESRVAELYDTETLLVDLSQGARGVVAGLRARYRAAWRRLARRRRRRRRLAGRGHPGLRTRWPTP